MDKVPTKILQRLSGLSRVHPWLHIYAAPEETTGNYIALGGGLAAVGAGQSRGGGVQERQRTLQQTGVGN